jgi:pimeloyl-ACP methyl ester carboxylesterase
MLHYEVTGNGPPVVLLHAGIVDSRIWQTTVPLLATEHTVLAYDQRGYGRSQRPNGSYSLIDDLAWVLDDAQLEQAALVGLSRGGRIAIDFRAYAPEAGDSPDPGRRGDVGASAATGRAREDRTKLGGGRGAWRPRGARRSDLAIWAPLGVDPELRAMTVENAEWSNGDDPGTWADPPAAGRLGSCGCRRS